LAETDIAGDVWRVRYALPFDGAAGHMIRALKYARRLSIARDLALLTLPVIRPLLETGIDAIQPVPLHRVRRRERGFNQCELLAHALVEDTLCPVWSRLARTRHTAPQAELPRTRRLTNPAGAFSVTGRVEPGARVLLLDDVVTTGATMAAAGRTLLEAGAGDVVCLAVAGTPLSGPKAVD
jgi:ComF family protein